MARTVLTPSYRSHVSRPLSRVVTDTPDVGLVTAVITMITPAPASDKDDYLDH